MTTVHSPPPLRRTTRQTTAENPDFNSARNTASELLNVSSSQSQGRGSGRDEAKVRKLDGNAYKPFGSRSRSSSDAGSDTAFCRGGSGKANCGEPVRSSDHGVSCDMCENWFHASCQEIPAPAYEALVSFKILSWLCPVCKEAVKNGETRRLVLLESKVDKLDRSMSSHIKLVSQSMREQEAAVDNQTKIIERSLRELHAQKALYADIVKGTCSEMCEKVSAKMQCAPDGVPTGPEPASSKGMAKVLDDFLDRDRRKNNLVIHNLPELVEGTTGERAVHDVQLFQDMAKEAFNIRVAVAKSFRVGRAVANRDRLLIVTLETPGVKWDLLRLAPQLRGCEKWGNIYITPDLTPAEREAAKKVREELAARKKAGETNLTIRRGRVVTAGKPLTHISGQSTDTTATGQSVTLGPGARSRPLDTSRPGSSHTQSYSGSSSMSSLGGSRSANEQGKKD